VKTVFVVGFFNSVFEKLKENYATELECGTIIWVRQTGAHGPINVREFKERFNDRMASGSSDLLILLASLRGCEYSVADVQSIISAGERRWPGHSLATQVYDDPGNARGVARRISDFGIPETGPRQIDLVFLQKRLAGRKILCVRETNHTSFERALRRAGFPAGAWNVVFEEETVGSGKLSTFISTLKDRSESYGRILYAWHGLKYLADRSRLKCPIDQSGDVKGVIDRFKEWLENEEPKADAQGGD
jgi:hypothetical protein